MLKKLGQKIFGVSQWRSEWQESLSESLKKAQAGINTSIVVVVARESDLYSELLFLLSFMGLSLGAVAAFFFRSDFADISEALIFPMAGFSLGASIFVFRRFYISRFIPRAVLQRVRQRAQSQFVDHFKSLRSHLLLVYFSELERKAYVVASPDIADALPSDAIQNELLKLSRDYNPANPIAALDRTLKKTGELIRATSLGVSTGEPINTHYAVFVAEGEKGNRELRIPIVRKPGDVN